MATDYFLKLGDIKGESHDAKFKDYIELLSFSHGASQSGSGATAGGLGTGKVSVQDIHFSHHMDAASPELFKYLATGKHTGDAVFIARKAGGEQETYLKITLKEVLVSSLQWAAHDGSSLPVENVSLNFTEIKFEYFKQDEKGKVSPVNPTTVNVKTNKVV